jgi:hypothetical protein
VAHPTPRDDERTARRAERVRGGLHLAGGGAASSHRPLAALEEARRVVERLALDVLVQRDGDGAGLGGVEQGAHRLRQRGEQLLGPRDAVEEAAQRAERVVDGDVGVGGMLELLEHRALAAVGERVAGQQEHGQAVGRRGRSAGEHVRRAGPDRRGAGQRRQAAAGLGVADRGVDHGLLVLGLVERQLGALLADRLPEAEHVAMAEDAEDRRHGAPDLAIALGVLRPQPADEGLRRGEPHRGRRHRAVHPPSSTRLVPVISAAAGEAA